MLLLAINVNKHRLLHHKFQFLKLLEEFQTQHCSHNQTLTASASAATKEDGKSDLMSAATWASAATAGGDLGIQEHALTAKQQGLEL